MSKVCIIQWDESRIYLKSKWAITTISSKDVRLYVQNNMVSRYYCESIEEYMRHDTSEYGFRLEIEYIN